MIRRMTAALVTALALLAPAQAADFVRIGPQASAAMLRAARPALDEPALELVYRVEGGLHPGDMTVDLAADFIAVRQDGRTTIYDYALRRILEVDEAGHGFTNNSLYAVVDFRRAETFNRRVERQALTGMKAADAARTLDPFWVQSELGVVESEDGPTVSLVRSEAPDGVHFAYQGAEVASYTPGQVPLDPAQGAMLRKFLLMTTALHPSIVAQIAQSGHLPRRIAFALPAWHKKPDAIWTLQEVHGVSVAYPLPQGATPRLESTLPPLDTLLPLMRDAVAGRAPGLRSAADYRAALEKAVADGKLFAAAILAFEFTEQYGLPAADCAGADGCHELKVIFPMAMGDPRAAALLGLLRSGDDHSPAAIATLSGLKRDDLADGYMVDDFLANSLVEAHRAAEAPPLFASAIRGNPYLAGYYKDLGDLFRYSFRPDSAWLCYDLGRALPGGANAPVVSVMNDYEAHLASAYPDFF